VTAATLSLASAYYAEGRLDDAEVLLRRVLTSYEASLGNEHPRMVVALNALATLQYKKQQYTAAEALYLKAVKIQEAGNGPVHDSLARTLHNLGLCYAAQGRYQDAELVYHRSLTIAEQSFGPAHQDVAVILADYATVLRKLRKKNEARSLEKQARVLRARDRESPSRFEVDWRELKNR
jgi:tetratricopeptide (TPR) repeat protein